MLTASSNSSTHTEQNTPSNRAGLNFFISAVVTTLPAE